MKKVDGYDDLGKYMNFMMVLRVAVGKKISFAEHNKGTRYSDHIYWPSSYRIPSRFEAYIFSSDCGILWARF